MDFMVIGQKKRIYDYPEHTHEYWEVILNIEGNGTAVIDGEEYAFGPGTIFCIRPDVVHAKKAAEGFVDGSVLIADFCFENEPGNVLVFQDDERQSFYRLYQVAFEYPMDPNVDVYANQFLRHVVDAMQNLLSHWRYSEGLNPDIQRVRRIMAEHVSDTHLDLETLIQSTGYSPNHFRKLFKEQCGCSPLQYYNRLKMIQAKKLIHQNKAIMTINEIARECGFEDPYYFSRLFKKISGYSPMQYYKLSNEDLKKPQAKKDRGKK